jgi:hypothetical protein
MLGGQGPLGSQPLSVLFSLMNIMSFSVWFRSVSLLRKFKLLNAKVKLSYKNTIKSYPVWNTYFKE